MYFFFHKPNLQPNYATYLHTSPSNSWLSLPPKTRTSSFKAFTDTFYINQEYVSTHLSFSSVAFSFYLPPTPVLLSTSLPLITFKAFTSICDTFSFTLTHTPLCNRYSLISLRIQFSLLTFPQIISLTFFR